MALLCSTHGKPRDRVNLERDGAGGYRCLESKRCKVSRPWARPGAALPLACQFFGMPEQVALPLPPRPRTAAVSPPAGKGKGKGMKGKRRRRSQAEEVVDGKSGANRIDIPPPKRRREASGAKQDETEADPPKRKTRGRSRSRTPRRGPAGRGRSSTTPAWLNSHPSLPSIPHEIPLARVRCIGPPRTAASSLMEAPGIPAPAGKFSWIIAKDAQVELLVINSQSIPDELIKFAKNLCNSLIFPDWSTSLSALTTHPQDEPAWTSCTWSTGTLDEHACVVRVPSGPYSNVLAASQGGNAQKNGRCLALAVCIYAEMIKPLCPAVVEETLGHSEFPLLVKEAREELEKERENWRFRSQEAVEQLALDNVASPGATSKASGVPPRSKAGRNRSRRSLSLNRARPPTPERAPKVHRSKRPASPPLQACGLGGVKKEVAKPSKRLMHLSDRELPTECVHGTSRASLPSIQMEGLKTGGGHPARLYIHFSPLCPRTSKAEIAIWIDLRKAMAENISFYMSDKGVILTKGIKGRLSPRFFTKIKDLKKNTVVYRRL